MPKSSIKSDILTCELHSLVKQSKNMSYIQAYNKIVTSSPLRHKKQKEHAFFLLNTHQLCYASFRFKLQLSMATPDSKEREQGFHLLHRYIWLIETILRFDGASFKQIQESWAKAALNTKNEPLPLKSFHNHKTAIAQLFGINISCKRKGGYRYHIENEQKHDNVQLKEWLVQALTLNQMVEDTQQLSEHILLEPLSGNISYLPLIMTSIRTGTMLDMTYQSHWKDHPSSFSIAPYCLKLFRQRWYVLAKSDLGDKLSIYSLDRIQSLSPTERPYSIPDDFKAASFFEDCFGISMEAESEEVRLKVYHDHKKHLYLQALPLHASQAVEEEAADFTILRYHLRPSYDFRQEILSHGSDLEVLTPQWLRDNIAEIYRKQYLLYAHGVRVEFDNKE